MTGFIPAAVGVLHPGAMGMSLVAALTSVGHRVYWCDVGRSAATRTRANDAGAIATASIAELAAASDLVISVCPPDAALSVAQQVADVGYAGIYLDANAIAPRSSSLIAEHFGGRYVDGGIVGPPAIIPGTTRLYLSGERACELAQLFASSPLEAVVLAKGGTAASALKMCYAAWTKGNSALLLSVCALAARHGVGAALESEWQRSQPGVQTRAEGIAAAVAPKAWRFSGEMREIADTYEQGGLPRGFHDAAAEFYADLATFKNQQGVSLADLLDHLSQH